MDLIGEVHEIRDPLIEVQSNKREGALVMLSINTDVLTLHKTHVAVKIQLGLRTRVQIRAGTRTIDES